MAGKEDIEITAPAAPASAAPSPHADVVLSGMAGALALKLRAASDAFCAEPADAQALAKTAQDITSLARAGISLHQMQAQEDKAADVREARVEERQVIKTRARVQKQFHPDEDDDMNEQDPRLEDPAAMARADKELKRRLAEIALEIKAANLSRRASKKASSGVAGQLVRPEPRQSTSPAV